MGTVPDLRPVPAYAATDKTALLARITAYNTAIAAIAAAYPGRVTAVDLFTGSAPLVSTITVSPDGFHPSDAGYALISERFAKAIADAGIPLR
jgi:lysophospholipase L1-like esterase